MRKLLASLILLIMAINILPADSSMSDGVSVEYIPGSFNLGIGTTSPNEKLTVAGKVSIQETTAPSLTTGYGKLFVDSTTSNLKFLDDAGTSYDLLTPLTGGGGASDIDGLSDAITSASSVFLGSSSGMANSGATDSTGVGVWALKSNTSGNSNAAIGYKSLALNTTGSGNTGSGAYTLYTNTTGVENTATGDLSLYYNTTGRYNTGAGSLALYNTTTGLNLTGVGSYAGYSGTSHSNGVYLGYKAGYANTTGDNNIAIGFQAGDNVTTGSSNITIGYDVDALSALASNQLNIGNTIYGQINNGNVGIDIVPKADKMTLNGVLSVRETTAPSLTSGYGKVYVDSTTSNLKFLDDAGTNYDLLSGASSFFDNYIKLSDQKSSGVDGQSISSGAWRARHLNTEDNDGAGNVSGVTSTGNGMTLSTGSYYCRIMSPMRSVGNVRLRLYNKTTASVALISSSMDTAGGDSLPIAMAGTFTVSAATEVFSLQYYSTGNQGNGGGTALGQGTEIYTVAECWKKP